MSATPLQIALSDHYYVNDALSGEMRCICARCVTPTRVYLLTNILGYSDPADVELDVSPPTARVGCAVTHKLCCFCDGICVHECPGCRATRVNRDAFDTSTSADVFPGLVDAHEYNADNYETNVTRYRDERRWLAQRIGGP